MRILLLLALLLGVVQPALAQRPTLDAVRARGSLNCGTNPGLIGFAQPDSAGVYRGLDADTCRAIAAAVFGDAGRVTFIGVTTPDAPRALRDRQVDVMARNLTLTMSRDVELGLAPTAVNFYDGQAFLARRTLNAGRIADLNGRRVCAPGGTTNESNLIDVARREGITITVVPTMGFAGFSDAYNGGQCDAVSAEMSVLLLLRATALQDQAAHVLLPDIVSREPLGPLVRDGDQHWRTLVFFVVNAMLEAELLGVTSANAQALRTSPSPRIRSFLGATPGLGTPLGLNDDWAFQVVRQVGNYAEVFDRSFGAQSPFRLERGLNDLYLRGGLMYPIPMR